MTVAENIGVVPRLLNWDRARMRHRAEELLAMLALEPAEFLDRYPNELSGGQAQRVGVARALAADPPVLLMDEPFGAVDPVNREVIQDEFLRMQKSLRKTVLFVSHDIDEAVKMADRMRSPRRPARAVRGARRAARPASQRIRRRLRRQRSHLEAPETDRGQRGDERRRLRATGSRAGNTNGDVRTTICVAWRHSCWSAASTSCAASTPTDTSSA